MQGGDPALEVKVDDYGGALPVRAARHVGVPAGFDQAHESVDRGRERWRLLGCVLAHTLAVAVVAFPVGDQGVLMRRQGGVEGGGFELGEANFPGGVLAVAGLGDRRPGRRLGVFFRLGCEFDGGAELVDRRGLGQLGIVGVGAVGGSFGDDADLIQRQPSLA
jgi:hypothetical protein